MLALLGIRWSEEKKKLERSMKACGELKIKPNHEGEMTLKKRHRLLLEWVLLLLLPTFLPRSRSRSAGNPIFRVVLIIFRSRTLGILSALPCAGPITSSFRKSASSKGGFESIRIFFAELEKRDSNPRWPLPPLPPLPTAVARPPPPPPPPEQNSPSKKNIPRPNISPALYAIPESTPLPDSPSSFPPASPYIINHKRRGPRLLKSFLRNDPAGSRLPPPQVEQKAEPAAENGVKAGENGVQDSEVDEEQKSGASNGGQGEPDSLAVELNGGKLEEDCANSGLVGLEELTKTNTLDTEKEAEIDDFFDLQDSLSASSNHELRSNSSLRYRPGTPSGEYFDAFEDISSDGTSRSYNRNIEDELREMRLNFLMEIERCKQAEEAIENLQNQWQILSHHLSLVGLRLPAPPSFTGEVEDQSNIEPAEELCQQIVVSRFVANAIGRASSCAEVQMVMEPVIESKNLEIARLQDRLQYYEAANREMSQRNQEAVELARQHRNKRKRRQKWIWSSIGLAVTLGVGAIVWSYLPASSKSTTPEGDASEIREP